MATNGISYTVYALPDRVLISGPTTIDPAGRDSVFVSYDLSGSFPNGQTALSIEVRAVNVLYNPNVDSTNGLTFSAMTYTADNHPPTFTSHVPQDSATYLRDQAVVVEVFFTDDTPAGILKAGNDAMRARENGSVSMKAVTRSGNSGTPSGRNGNLDEGSSNGDVFGNASATSAVRGSVGSNRNGRLDDNGSGIMQNTIRMSIYDPSGVNVGPATVGDFQELDAAHAKFILTPHHQAGEYTVNVRIEDCVGNVGAVTYPFTIRSLPPSVTFCPVQGDCSYDNYWNPAEPLRLCATIQELDAVNTTREGIRVDIYRAYACSTGVCEELLIGNANYAITPEPDPVNTNQTFTVTGAYNLDQNIAATEIRIKVTATNANGATTLSAQPWIVDKTAPVVTVVSPAPNSVVPASQVVTISANFSDDPGGVIAKMPTKGMGDASRTSSLGPVRKTSVIGNSGRSRLDDNSDGLKSALGNWSTALNRRSLDDLDQFSGVNLESLQLHLVPRDGSPVRDLKADTDHLFLRPNNVTWTGALPQGDYTVMLLRRRQRVQHGDAELELHGDHRRGVHLLRSAVLHLRLAAHLCDAQALSEH